MRHDCRPLAFRPCRASSVAATRPLWPAPTTATSKSDVELRPRVTPAMQAVACLQWRGSSAAAYSAAGSMDYLLYVANLCRGINAQQARRSGSTSKHRTDDGTCHTVAAQLDMCGGNLEWGTSLGATS
jgi:hypothetical protein